MSSFQEMCFGERCVRSYLIAPVVIMFVVVGDKDVVILKSITPAPIDEFDELIAKARRDGKKAGLKKADIAEAIKKSSGQKMKIVLDTNVFISGIFFGGPPS